ncbi:FadR/GntR family transcriptional regulator [Pseudoclavibacter soli]|uniref:FadR/GntR family transcriptional regulator n=1 Tax=Pseudoclavibacter soli TaxID=452623 RepID=UPI00040ED29F|nr:FCD domain-containing protein [Pseudoclavibacter soli]
MSWVREQLADGSLSIGDRLPGERALAEQLGVSRGAVREGLRVLEALGTLTSATGSGPTAGTIVVAEPQEALALAFNLQLATHHVGFGEVVQTRLLLETWAARNADPSYNDWDDASRLLDRMDEPDLDKAQFLALDAAFHAQISKAAGNPLISTLMDGLRKAISDHTLERAEQLPDWPATSATLQQHHRAILEALSTHDNARAAALVEEHITWYNRLTQPTTV